MITLRKTVTVFFAVMIVAMIIPSSMMVNASAKSSSYDADTVDNAFDNYNHMSKLTV